MKQILMVAISVLIAWSLVPVEASAKPRVLVTAFEPFGGASDNRSMAIADKIRKRIGDEVDVQVCVLPVEYDRAAEVAKKCYEQMIPKPAMVVSMGERRCEVVQLETAAHNVDHFPELADNSGLYRSNRAIDPSAARSLGLEAHVAEMYCSISSFYRDSITISATPGGYVCNNTAYHLGRFFQTKKIPFSFIHVPLSSCGGSNLNYDASWMISDMILKSPAVGLSGKMSSALLRSVAPRMPTKVDELDKILRGLSQAPSSEEPKSCYEEFYRRLRRQLAP